MEKQRQKQLQKWLKLQSRTIKKFIHLNVLFGSLSALLMIGQMWLLATILQKVMLENIASNTLMTELGCLISCFAGRALLIWARERVGFMPEKLYGMHYVARLLKSLLILAQLICAKNQQEVGRHLC